PTPTPTPTFRDISGDIYRSEIEAAVRVGFISGFLEDNTFRPQSALTREQVVSMVLDAMGALPDVNPNAPAQVNAAPFPDVAVNRWSAAKIQWAKASGIVTGYPDGNFRPSQAVTRAELMVIMKKAAEYAKTQKGMAMTLGQTQNPFAFSDTSTHWARSLISEMSGYCGVASPVNEQGTQFQPNSPALRNYAAAATLRMYNCVRNGQ
ncbi:S-layer homology domain-containing protein, partial [Spirulina subsalsa CS-330]